MGAGHLLLGELREGVTAAALRAGLLNAGMILSAPAKKTERGLYADKGGKER